MSSKRGHFTAPELPPLLMRLQRPLLAVLVFAGLSWALLSALAPPPIAADGAIRLRIGVVADGIYRLTPADLLAAGVDPATIDPRTFALSSQGWPVAMRVVGEADGHFDAGDAIEFFGQRFRSNEQDEKYTAERVYWLEADAGPGGARVPDQPATPLGDLAPPTHFPAVVRAEQSRYWFTLWTTNPPAKDTWFWEQLKPASSAGVTASFTATVPFPRPDAGATIWIDQNARSNVNHRTELSFNGADLGAAAWSGVARSHISRTIPPGVLVHGANTLSDRATLVPPTPLDWVYFNYWEVHYRRLFRAWEGRLDFVAEAPGPTEYLSNGWETAPIAVWDITNAEQPRRLTGAVAIPSGQGLALRFRVAADAPGNRYWLQTEATLAPPASIRLRPPTSLRNPAAGADVVIVTSAALRPAAERLAVFDRQRGFQARVVEFQDVVDEFNYGIYHPRAVTSLLAWAQAHWPDPKPRFLTLFGDGHWNFKNYNPALYPPQPQHIPPYLAWVDPAQGEVPADPWYGDLDGDRLPDLAVGRIAVNSLDEANAVLDKIESYDESGLAGPWQQNAIFIADDEDQAGDFAAISDAIIDDYLPVWFTPQRLYLKATVPDAAAARTAIGAAIDAGALLLQYTGHGNPSRWTHEEIWTLADVPGLQNGSRLPVVMTFNCLDGYFAHPQPDLFSLAETMQRQPNGGSIAAISPSGLGYTFDQYQYRRLLMQSLFHDGVYTLGDALLRTQQRFFALTGPHYLIDTMMLYGDPTLHMPLPDEQLFMPLVW